MSILHSLNRQGFRLASRLRGARIFHPRGLTLAGRLHVTGQGPLPEGETDCVVRVSKGVGTPGGAPDVLGLAVRVLTDEPFDALLASTAGTRGWRRLVLSPAASWGRLRLSSLMPWADEEGNRVFLAGRIDDLELTDTRTATVAEHLPMDVRLYVSGPGGVRQTGVLVVTGPDRPEIDYDPVLRHPSGWRLVPDWLAGQRIAAYDGSRRGRHAALLLRDG